MRGEVRAGLLAAWCALACAPVAAMAQGSSPFVGRWQLNPAQSHAPAGETPPKQMTVDITRVDALHVRWTTTTSDGSGQATAEAFDEPANGEFYPIGEDTMVALRLAGDALQATFRSASGETDALSCTVSPDGRRLTCNGSIGDPNGKPTPYVDVFDRK